VLLVHQLVVEFIWQIAMRVVVAKLLAIALVFCFFTLSQIPSIECLFKLVKKKKFMEGFLVGFLVGNEYALHKSPSKGNFQ